jgi:hypothetical protein
MPREGLLGSGCCLGNDESIGEGAASAVDTTAPQTLDTCVTFCHNDNGTR